MIIIVYLWKKSKLIIIKILIKELKKIKQKKKQLLKHKQKKIKLYYQKQIKKKNNNKKN